MLSCALLGHQTALLFRGVGVGSLWSTHAAASFGAEGNRAAIARLSAAESGFLGPVLVLNDDDGAMGASASTNPWSLPWFSSSAGPTAPEPPSIEATTKAGGKEAPLDDDAGSGDGSVDEDDEEQLLVLTMRAVETVPRGWEAEGARSVSFGEPVTDDMMLGQPLPSLSHKPAVPELLEIEQALAASPTKDAAAVLDGAVTEPRQSTAPAVASQHHVGATHSEASGLRGGADFDALVAASVRRQCDAEKREMRGKRRGVSGVAHVCPAPSSQSLLTALADARPADCFPEDAQVRQQHARLHHVPLRVPPPPAHAPRPPQHRGRVRAEEQHLALRRGHSAYSGRLRRPSS